MTILSPKRTGEERFAFGGSVNPREDLNPEMPTKIPVWIDEDVGSQFIELLHHLYVNKLGGSEENWLLTRAHALLYGQAGLDQHFDSPTEPDWSKFGERMVLKHGRDQEINFILKEMDDSNSGDRRPKSFNRARGADPFSLQLPPGFGFYMTDAHSSGKAALAFADSSKSKAYLAEHEVKRPELYGHQAVSIVIDFFFDTPEQAKKAREYLATHGFSLKHASDDTQEQQPPSVEDIMQEIDALDMNLVRDSGMALCNTCQERCAVTCPQPLSGSNTAPSSFPPTT